MLKIVDGLHGIAKKYDATPGQIALAWLLAQGPDVIPIPGTRRIKVRGLHCPSPAWSALNKCVN